MAGKERGTKVLLKVGGGITPSSPATTIGVGNSAGVITVTNTGGALLDAAQVGQRIQLSGMAMAANNFNARITAVGTDTVTVKDPVDPITGLPVVPVTEAAGASATVALESFSTVSGQKTGSAQGQANSIDTTDKTTGDWGSNIAGTRTLTVQCGGQAVWPDTAGLKRLETAFATGEDVNILLIKNVSGDHWYLTASITSLQIEGADNGVTSYSATLVNRTAPSNIAGP